MFGGSPSPVGVEQGFYSLPADGLSYDPVRAYWEYDPFSERLVDRDAGRRFSRDHGTVWATLAASLDDTARPGDRGLVDGLADRVLGRWRARHQRRFRATVEDAASTVLGETDPRSVLHGDPGGVERDLRRTVAKRWDGPSVTVESVEVTAVSPGPVSANRFLIGTVYESFGDAVEFPGDASTDDVVFPAPGQDVARLRPYLHPTSVREELGTPPDVVDGARPDRAGRRDLRRLSELGVDTDAATERDALGNVYLLLPEGHRAFEVVEAVSDTQFMTEFLQYRKGAEGADPPRQLRGTDVEAVGPRRLADLYAECMHEGYATLLPTESPEWARKTRNQEGMRMPLIRR